MENKYFPLGNSENNGIVRIIRIVFGIVCIAVAGFWLGINIRSLKTTGTLWITILFLCGFGIYQILSGLGKTTTFIELGSDCIRLKKNGLSAPSVMNVSEIEKIEIFPMNVIFILKSGKRIMLRFGAVYQDINEDIKDEILTFADINNVPLEFKVEKL
jgi:hypothetical protein